jgi:AcrR family transcriptional regulator
MNTARAAKRSYRQGARAVAAEETGQRILDAFARRIREDWHDQVTLEQIAHEAGVSVPTIIRRFGGKEQLFEATWERLAREVQARRAVAAGDALGAVRAIVADYEVIGDMVMRSLVQEERFPALKPLNDQGRADHRAWIETTFAPWLAGLGAVARRERVDALVAATDLYVWKLVRRDMGRSIAHVRRLMLTLIEGALGERLASTGE